MFRLNELINGLFQVPRRAVYGPGEDAEEEVLPAVRRGRFGRWIWRERRAGTGGLIVGRFQRVGTQKASPVACACTSTGVSWSCWFCNEALRLLD